MVEFDNAGEEEEEEEEEVEHAVGVAGIVVEVIVAVVVVTQELYLLLEEVEVDHFLLSVVGEVVGLNFYLVEEAEHYFCLEEVEARSLYQVACWISQEEGVEPFFQVVGVERFFQEEHYE